MEAFREPSVRLACMKPLGESSPRVERQQSVGYLSQSPCTHVGLVLVRGRHREGTSKRKSCHTPQRLQYMHRDILL